METEDVTQLRVSTALVSAVNAVRGYQPKDAQATPELLRQLKELATYIEKSPRSDAAPVCTLASKMVEQLDSKSDAKPEILVPWIQQLLEYLCATLGVKTEGETKQLKALQLDLATSSLAVSRYRRSMEEGTRFGEMMVSMAFLKQEDVQRALNLQRVRNCPLGEAMVELGFLSRKGLDAALRMQKQKRKPDGWKTDRKEAERRGGEVDGNGDAPSRIKKS